MKKIAIVMLLMTIHLSFSYAQSPDEILDRYFENSGGKEKFRAIETIHMIGSLATPQGDFPFEIYQKSPNKIYVTVNIMGQKIVPQAFDGVTAWTMNPLMGNPSAQKLPDAEALVLKEEAYLDGPFMDYADQGYQVTYEGTEERNDKNCHILKLVKNLADEGSEWSLTCYFDAETYFPVMISRISDSGQYAGQVVENYYDNYQDTGNGLIMSYSIEMMISGQSIQRLVFQSINVNEDIPDELFEYPGD